MLPLIVDSIEEAYYLALSIIIYLQMLLNRKSILKIGENLNNLKVMLNPSILYYKCEE